MPATNEFTPSSVHVRVGENVQLDDHGDGQGPWVAIKPVAEGITRGLSCGPGNQVQNGLCAVQKERNKRG
jgi:hypothetical protein